MVQTIDSVRQCQPVSREAYRQSAVMKSSEGDGFDPQNVPDPTTHEKLEIPNGRGLLLMRRLMTRIRHNQRGNSVEMWLLRVDDSSLGGRASTCSN